MRYFNFAKLKDAMWLDKVQFIILYGNTWIIDSNWKYMN